MLFVGYTYRWIRILDDLSIDRTASGGPTGPQCSASCCGEAPHTANYWGINWNGYVDEEIPLRKELRVRGLLDRTVPWLR